MKKRVLLIRSDVGTFDPRVQKLGGSLINLGYEVAFFGWDRRLEVNETETYDGITYTRLRKKGVYGSSKLLLYLPFWWYHITRYVLKTKPDVIYACDLDSYVGCLIAARFHHLPVIYDIFDHYAEKLDDVPEWFRSLVRKFDYWIMKFADSVIIGADDRKALLPAEKVRDLQVIINSPPLYETAPAPKTPKKGDLLQLCYSGSIVEHRGLYFMIEATKDLPGVRTIFAGWIPRDEDREALLAAKHITYIGKIPYRDSLRLMTESDIILGLFNPRLPHHRFVNSNKIFEAMNARRPILTNIEHTMSPLVQELDCGLLIPYGDVEAFHAAVRNVQERPEEIERLGANGYKAFVERYHWGLMEDRLRRSMEFAISRIK